MPRHIQQNPVCVATLETRWTDCLDFKEVRAQGHRTEVGKPTLGNRVTLVWFLLPLLCYFISVIHCGQCTYAKPMAMGIALTTNIG